MLKRLHLAGRTRTSGSQLHNTHWQDSSSVRGYNLDSTTRK